MGNRSIPIRSVKVSWLTKALSLFLLLSLTCLITIACGSTTASINSSSTSQSASEITVATEDDNPPFDFLKDGRHVGYNQELLDLIAQGAPFKIKQEVLPWQGILAGVAAGKYAASNATAAIVEERTKSLDFTMPTTELTNHYLKRKGDSSIQSIQDLSGKVIGVQQGSVTVKLIDTYLAPELAKSGAKLGNVVQFGAFAEAYQDLSNKRVDVVINNIIALAQLVKEKPELYEIGEKVGPTTYGSWTVQKGNKEVLNFLNAALEKSRANGKMKELQLKWLGISFDDLPNEPKLPNGASIS